MTLAQALRALMAIMRTGLNNLIALFVWQCEYDMYSGAKTNGDSQIK